MYGFFGTFGQSIDWNFAKLRGDFLTREMACNHLALIHKTLPKFLKDKPFVDTPDYFFAIDGVVFEPQNLLHIPALYEKEGETFFKSFRGSFLGLFYDKKRDLLLIFNDHIGEKMLFYTELEDAFVFASDFYVLAQSLDFQEIKLNEKFLWSMLTYGYSLGDYTIASDVKRLCAGEYLRIEKGKFEKRRYHQFTFSSVEISENEALEGIDFYFRQAVSRVLKKDEQYDLHHVMSLSAGLDSRMSVCVARALTDTPINVITYSESGYYDELIPREIAQEWNLNLHFSPLDGGDYLKKIDQSVACTNGLVQYSGAAQVLVGKSMLDAEKSGILLTGMYGDALLSSRHKHRINYFFGEGALSQKFLSKLKPFFPDFNTLFPENEAFYLYLRGFSCANMGTPVVMQLVTETSSPFYDVDFMEFVSKIPPEMRFSYRLYDKWVQKYYPQAAKWLHNGTRKIGSSPKKVKLFGRSIAIADLPKRLFWYACKRLKIHDFSQITKGKSMNPLDSWFENNATLNQTLNDYFHENIHLLTDKAVRDAATDLFKSGVMMEKLQTITLLSAIKLLRE